MEGWGVAVLGLLIGMQHALEADHLAAMATLFADKAGCRQLIKRGISWGLGHTTTLLIMCSVVLFLDLAITPQFEAGVELFVGLMVLGLGLNLALTIKRKRIHAHRHEHAQGVQHLHIHSHENSENHQHETHHNPHANKTAAFEQAHTSLTKPFTIGLVHGIAGSGALLLVVVATANSIIGAFSYVALFGLGSIGGMALLSLVVSYPLNILGRMPGGIFRAAMLSVSAFAMSMGSYLILVSWSTLAQTY